MAEDYYYDAVHHSAVFCSDNKTCIMIDFNLCDRGDGTAFDYSKYCEMQNKWMNSADKLYRFHEEDGKDICEEIADWLDKDSDSIEVSDRGGVFDKVHVDNTPLEKKFEDLFTEAYGNDDAI